MKGLICGLLVLASAALALSPLSPAAEAHATVTMQKIHIDIPTHILSRVQDEHLIPATYLAVLAKLSGRERIDASSGDTRIVYNEGGEPEKRFEAFGDPSYGLVMQGDPIASGVGVHGETGDWSFHGLPAGIALRGSHRLDMRGGSNYINLSFASADPALQVVIAESFAQAIRDLLAPPTP